MAEPLKVGDLAMVIFPSNCGHSCGLGRVFTVAGITDAVPYDCSECNAGGGWSAGVLDERSNWYSMRRVKRVDPPKERVEECVVESVPSKRATPT